MAAYGKGQMLGSGINPESFKQDYSGFANAAAIQAQGLSNLGQSIGGAIQDYGKIKKQQQEDERSVQKSKSVAKAIGDLIPDLKPTLQNSLLLLDDKEIPLSQRKAEADAISDILTLGIGAISNKQKLDFEKSKLIAENAPDPLSFTPKLLDAGPGKVAVKEGSDGKYYDEDGIYPIRNMQAYIAGEPPEVYSGAGAVPSPAAGINSALKLTGNLKADANAINNATPLPEDYIYTADGSPGSLPPVGTPVAGADTSLLPPVLGNNDPEAEMPPPQAETQAPRKLTSRLIQDSKQEEGRVYTIDQVNELASKGIKIKGTPLPNGDLFGTSYETLAPQQGKEVIYNPDGTITMRDVAVGGDLNKSPTTNLKEGEALVPDPTSPTGTKIVQIPSEPKEKALNDFSNYITQIGDSYAKLNQMGKAVSGGEANPLNYAFSTPLGQTIATMFGEEGQPLRAQIATMVPNIINVIRQSTQMGAKGMDSEKELQFYLRSVGDPQLPLEANFKALDALDKAYGKGNAVESILKNYPELAQKVNKYKLTAPTESTGTSGSLLTPEEQDLKNKYKPAPK